MISCTGKYKKEIPTSATNRDKIVVNVRYNAHMTVGLRIYTVMFYLHDLQTVQLFSLSGSADIPTQRQ